MDKTQKETKQLTITERKTNNKNYLGIKRGPSIELQPEFCMEI